MEVQQPELKKKHSPRLVGGAEMGNQVERTREKVVAGGLEQARLQMTGKAEDFRLGGPTFMCR